MSWQPRLPAGVSGFRRTNEGFIAEVSIPADEEGFFGRECPDCQRFFKMRVDQWEALPDEVEITCPYCGHQTSDASDFTTPDQLRRVESAAATLAEQYAHKMFHDAFHGLQTPRLRRGQSASRSGSAAIRLRRPGRYRAIPKKQVRRTIACESCETQYAVYGATAFCPVCGPRGAAETVLEAIERGRQSLALEDALPDELREEARASGLFDKAAA